MPDPSWPLRTQEGPCVSFYRLASLRAPLDIQTKKAVLGKGVRSLDRHPQHSPSLEKNPKGSLISFPPPRLPPHSPQKEKKPPHDMTHASFDTSTKQGVVLKSNQLCYSLNLFQKVAMWVRHLKGTLVRLVFKWEHVGTKFTMSQTHASTPVQFP